jgi:hypothetical protein
VSFAAGLELAALGLAAPAAVADGSVFGDVTFFAGRVWAPAVRLSIHRSQDASPEAPGATATLTWTFGRVEACPLPARIAALLEVRPCLLVDAGALQADGSGAPHAQSRLRPWSAGGGLVRLQWWAFPSVEIEAAGGLLTPFVRESFVLLPSTPVYEAPLLAATAGLGVAVRLR